LKSVYESPYDSPEITPRDVIPKAETKENTDVAREEIRNEVQKLIEI